MVFYDLPKEERILLVEKINQEVFDDFSKRKIDQILIYASDEDTYIRKTAYQTIGKTFNVNRNLRSNNITSEKANTIYSSIGPTLGLTFNLN